MHGGKLRLSECDSGRKSSEEEETLRRVGRKRKAGWHGNEVSFLSSSGRSGQVGLHGEGCASRRHTSQYVSAAFKEEMSADVRSCA